MNSFYNDDLAQRVFILWIMAILVIYGNNAILVEEDIGAMRATVGAYMAARWSSNTVHLIYSFSSYHHRAQQRLWFVLSGLTLCLYIPLFIEDFSIRSKIAVAAVAITMEECIWIFSYSPVAKKLLKARYTTAVDIAHEVDRFAAFYIIVLGEFLYQIVVHSPAAVGFNMRLMRAIWTLIIAFCLNWLYVHNDGSLESVHPYRHNIWASFMWVTIHLPLVASLLVAGHVSALSASLDEVHEGELWFLCGGLGIGLICLYLIALLHRSQDEPGTLMLPKVKAEPPLQFAGAHLLTLLLAHSSNIPADSSDYHYLSAAGPWLGYLVPFIHRHGADCPLPHMGKYHVINAGREILGEMGEYKISRGKPN
jgi:low temperature requirement protein LtrA